MESKNELNIEELAKDFSKRLLEYNGIENMRAIVELNKMQKNTCICHSHDYCDSNQFIIDTLENIDMEFPYPQSYDDTYSDNYFEVVDKVWNMAKENEFYTKNIAVV